LELWILYLIGYGMVEEAMILVKELSVLRISTIAILGNHD
jgi:diphthamide biosynthesis methyltransferase